MKFIFPGFETLSGNKYLRMHWTVRKKLHDKYGLLIQGAYKSSQARGDDAHADRFMCVSFVAYRKRLLDDDNLLNGLKPFRDCFVKMGFLRDDSPKWAKFIYTQYTLKDSPFASDDGKPKCGLIVTIEANTPVV